MPSIGPVQKLVTKTLRTFQRWHHKTIWSFSRLMVSLWASQEGMRRLLARHLVVSTWPVRVGVTHNSLNPGPLFGHPGWHLHLHCQAGLRPLSSLQRWHLLLLDYSRRQKPKLNSSQTKREKKMESEMFSDTNTFFNALTPIGGPTIQFWYTLPGVNVGSPKLKGSVPTELPPPQMLLRSLGPPMRACWVTSVVSDSVWPYGL